MRVLIADDDRLVCDLLAEYVERCNHEVAAKVTAGGLAAIRGFAQYQPDLVLLDVIMPKCNGLTVCHAMLSRNPSARIVLMSGLVDKDHPYIEGCNAAAFLHKPMLFEDVRRVLEQFSGEEKITRFASVPVEEATGEGTTAGENGGSLTAA